MFKWIFVGITHLFIKKPATGRLNANTREEEEPEYEQKGAAIPGAYNPADYAHLEVSNEIKELFRYISRYQPETKELESKLKPFIPEYYPTVGEVDAYIKMARPDGKDEPLGLNILVNYIDLIEWYLGWMWFFSKGWTMLEPVE